MCKCCGNFSVLRGIHLTDCLLSSHLQLELRCQRGRTYFKNLHYIYTTLIRCLHDINTTFTPHLHDKIYTTFTPYLHDKIYTTFTPHLHDKIYIRHLHHINTTFTQHYHHISTTKLPSHLHYIYATPYKDTGFVQFLPSWSGVNFLRQSQRGVTTLYFEQNCTFSSISQSILNRLPWNLHKVGLIFRDNRKEG